MKKKKSVLSLVLVLAMLLSLCCFPVAEGKEAQAAQTLVWSDEFNGNSLNLSNWTFDIGNGGWGNNELQYYTNRSENVSVSDGVLKITARQENYNGSAYTSTRIKTQGLKSFKYGKIEARIAMPNGQGLWPAFWMLGNNITTDGWPKCGEIDIMEHVNSSSTVYGTVHWDANGHAEYGGNIDGIDVTQYHVYTVEWDAEYIRWYLDGTKYHEIYIGNGNGSTEEFHQEFFIILNLAVGGNWPGSPNGTASFPSTMYVDYVRVYQGGGSSSSGSGTGGNSGSSSSGSSAGDTSSGMGITSAGGNAATVYVNDSSWADIHYSVNGGGQQNVRMTQSGSKATYTINGLNSGDTVKYWFTYSNTSGYVTDTASATYTHGSGSSGNSGNSGTGGNSNSSSSGSSSLVTVYQDINYGGYAVSLDTGSYTLSDLISRGVKNDDLTSLRVPFGYKVTLYQDDNFRGNTRVVTSDTAYLDGFNDVVSSIVIERAQYKIINRNSGFALDIANVSYANGANLQQWGYGGGNNQKWSVIDKGDGYYMIVSVMHGKAIDVAEWSQADGGNVQLWDQSGDVNQLWRLDNAGDGYVSIVNKGSQKALDVAEWSKAEGGNVQQWGYGGQSNQQWQFVLVN